jgi:hypothetical protein
LLATLESTVTDRGYAISVLTDKNKLVHNQFVLNHKVNAHLGRHGLGVYKVIDFVVNDGLLFLSADE